MRSRVKWFDNRKGYGFLEYNDKEDIYVHYTSIIDEGYKSLVEGEEVEFELVKTPNGYKAKKVVSVKEYGIC